jgi:hypothetical protein
MSNFARRALVAIVGTVTPTTMISVGDRDRAGSEIYEFRRKSAIGCIPDGAGASRFPSGPGFRP